VETEALEFIYFVMLLLYLFGKLFFVGLVDR
jgi:hypothetical protein